MPPVPLKNFRFQRIRVQRVDNQLPAGLQYSVALLHQTYRIPYVFNHKPERDHIKRTLRELDIPKMSIVYLKIVLLSNIIANRSDINAYNVPPFRPHKCEIFSARTTPLEQSPGLFDPS